MTKPIFLFLSLCVGSIGFSALHRTTNQIRTAATIRHEQWQAASNGLAATRAAMLAAQAEVLDKRNRLLQARRHPALSPELLLLLEKDGFTGHSAAWAELRQQLGIGWDTSPDYVLVRKQVLKQLNHPRLFGDNSRASDVTSGLLGLSPAEQSALEAVLGRIRRERSLAVQRAEPRGDVVAHYTMPAVDPSSEQTLSNRFAAEIISVLSPERSDFLLPDAWWELKADVAPPVANTMTIRKTLANGQPDLICEMSDGFVASVRYGRYPSGWFLTLFPDWKALAEQEGFELPSNCQRPPNDRSERLSRDSNGVFFISITPTNAP
ncbi:MAG: hypothetical protein WCK27_00400 [Verrucomicrobiota bacterium]